MWLPQLWWSRPSSIDEALFLEKCSGLNYDVRYSGVTSEAPFTVEQVEQLKKDGFWINQRRVKLGCGEQAFRRGRQTLRNWRHLQLGNACVDQSTEITPANKFGIYVRQLVTWLISPAQILYVTDTFDGQSEAAAPIQAKSTSSLKSTRLAVFAFGFGALRGHLMAGEARFAVEWNLEDDSVWYEFLSFSKPAHFLSLAALPIVRFQQVQFAKHSSELMLRDANGDA